MSNDRRYKRVCVDLNLKGEWAWVGNYVVVGRGEVLWHPGGRCLGRLSLWDQLRVHGWGEELIARIESLPEGVDESGPVLLKVYLPGEASPGWRWKVLLTDAASTAAMLAPAVAAAALAWAAYAYFRR